MKKKIIIISVILLVAALGGVFWYAATAPTMKYNKDGNLIYNGRVYIDAEDNTGFWYCDYESAKMNEIGWSWSIVPLLSKVVFYADNSEHPDYICGVYGPTDIFFKEGYDYTEEVFVIHGHPLASVRFSDSYNEDSFIEEDAYHSAITSFNWSPEGHHNLWNSPEIYLINNKYYIQFVWDQPYYEVSEDFLSILMDEGIISIS